ncbi:MAG: hypothetical protein HKN87_11610 [Saprospiraceae bacterium]|nr:hypothetical protein [Saprospiraceae bacterium]
MPTKYRNTFLAKTSRALIYFVLIMVGAHVLVGCISVASEDGGSKSIKPSIFDKLSSEAVLEFQLTANWDSVEFHKVDEKYVPALISSVGSMAAEAMTEEIKISARGNTRKAYCEVLPIRLRFPKAMLKASRLAKYKTLKLVLPCMDGLDYSDLLKKEMLCYKLFQTLTNHSFRVQPARVFLVNDDELVDTVYKEAFLIENDKEMAKRLGGKRLDKAVTSISIIDAQSYNLMVLFQYMIGNTDWNLSKRHNIELVVTDSSSAPIAIPYDFDYSGLVNAPYAHAHPDLPIANVRERLFQWRGNDGKTLVEPITIFIENKSRIFDLLENCSLHDKQAKVEMIRYIEEFYAIIESPEAVDLLRGS